MGNHDSYSDPREPPCDPRLRGGGAPFPGPPRPDPAFPTRDYRFNFPVAACGGKSTTCCLFCHWMTSIGGIHWW